jgi:hypothetical protein
LRSCRWASRELDALLAEPADPWSYSVAEGSIDYHATWLDRGVPEREHRGRELAAAGWLP